VQASVFRVCHRASLNTRADACNVVIQQLEKKLMKSTLFAIALATAGLAASPALSHAADAGGFFINGNIGESSLDHGPYNDNDTGYMGNIGYRWALNPSVALGIEGGYTDLGKFAPRNGQEGLEDASIKGWNLGVNGHFNFTPEWYVSGRFGWFGSDLKGQYYDANDAIVTVDGTANKYYVGAGIGYDFSNNFSLGLNYDYYKANKNGLNLDPSLVSVSGEFRF
jgi:opacity protein-like surface antigen